jgi:hypothetical protein
MATGRENDRLSSRKNAVEDLQTRELGEGAY